MKQIPPLGLTHGTPGWRGSCSTGYRRAHFCGFEEPPGFWRGGVLVSRRGGPHPSEMVSEGPRASSGLPSCLLPAGRLGPGPVSLPGEKQPNAQTRAGQWTWGVSHRCHLKFSSSHVSKGKKNFFHNISHLTQ